MERDDDKEDDEKNIKLMVNFFKARKNNETPYFA